MVAAETLGSDVASPDTPGADEWVEEDDEGDEDVDAPSAAVAVSAVSEVDAAAVEGVE